MKINRMKCLSRQLVLEDHYHKISTNSVSNHFLHYLKKAKICAYLTCYLHRYIGWYRNSIFQKAFLVPYTYSIVLLYCYELGVG